MNRKCPASAPLARKKSALSLENTRKMWKRRNISRFSLAGIGDGKVEKSLAGFLKIKSERWARQWTRFWVVLDCSILSFFHAQTDINPMFQTNLKSLQIMPGDCYTKRRFSFRCVGDKCDLLISASCKDDLVRWMNAASLASIGYSEEQISEGIGQRKNRYQNSSIRIYRRNYTSVDCHLQEHIDRNSIESDAASIQSSAETYSEIQMRGKRNMSSSPLPAIRTSVINLSGGAVKDDIMRLVDYVDITSGLTRKQTMKRRAANLAPDPVLNDILHRQMQNERQLKALQDDLAKIDALLTGVLTEEKIAEFERDHAEIVPELYQKRADASLDSSISTVSDSSSFDAV